MYVKDIHTTSDRMLCSKDLVKRAIEFRTPERVPYNFDSNRTPVTAERYGEDFVAMRVDVLQIDQQDNMGIDELARRFAGRLCFFCPVDIQTTLPVGAARDSVAKARHLMKAFGSRGGGFLAKTYPQPEAIGIPEENTRVMCEAFKTFGRYPFVF